MRARFLRTLGVSFVVCLALGFIARSARAADPVKAGGPIPVGAVDGWRYSPRVAVDPGGSFLVAWDDDQTNEVRARAFWSNGNAQGPEFEMSSPDPFLDVGTAVFDEDEALDVAADAAGNFVVAYHAYDERPGQPCNRRACIFTKRRDADGNVAAADFLVGDPRLFTYEYEYNATINPELAADGDGDFIVAWEGYDAQRSGVWARKLVGSGQVSGSQFRINDVTTDYQGEGGDFDVAADGSGNFVVLWRDSYDPSEGIVAKRFDDAKNPLGPQILVAADGVGGRVAQLPDGTFMAVWDNGLVDRIDGRVYDPSGAPVGPAFVVSTEGDYPQIAASAAGSFVVVYPSLSGLSGRTFDSSGAATSSEFIVDTNGAYPHVSAAANGDFVVTFVDGFLGYVYAQRFQAASPSPKKIPVLGKVVLVTNKDPDDFEKSVGRWKAGGTEIEVPLRGSASDPRCLGDPPGTVKAAVRFLSTTSGEDLTIELPCQNWTVTGGNKVGSVAKRGFKYSDGKRLAGPCTSVKIKGTKSLGVTCKGKPGTAAFGYDLKSGQSQGALTTVLQLGQFEYCSEFQPLLDGSDGQKYKGKAIAAPTACP